MTRSATLALLIAVCLAVPLPGSASAAPPVDEGKALDLCSHARAARARIEADRQPHPPDREADADTDVTHYFLDIEIIPVYSGPDVSAVEVAGVCTIDAQAATDGLTLFTVDLRDNLTVNAVTGNVASWSRVGDTIEITLDQTYNTGQAFQVVVDYQGEPADPGFGAFHWWIRGGDLVVATLSEPYYAHYWWPCKDALDDKSTMQMHVTVPDPLVAVSNGLDLGTETLSGGRTKYLWQETYPIIPYLASLAITAYERYDLSFEYDDGGGPLSMPVPCYVYPDHWDYNAGEPAGAHKVGCDELPTMLDVFSQQFRLYPFITEKYGVVETGGSGGLGASMEHQTISSMWRVENYSDIMAHELAHQWWGDEVTCQTWYDIWLNEGFASYSEAIFREFEPGGGVSSYWSRVNARRPTDPDAQVYRTSIDTVGDIFSGNDVYNKGSWVLHMLRHVLGTEAYFAALADYRATYQHNSATTAEFTTTFSTSFGHDLTWFTDEWVMNPGSPDYEWNYTPANVAGQNYVKLAIWQRQNLDGYGLITMPIDIRVTTLATSTVHRVWNDGWTEYYVIPINGALATVELDEDGGTDDRNWVLSDSRALVSTPIAAPPVLLAADITVFSDTPGETAVALVFSEDIGELDTADLALTGDTSGSHAPSAVSYEPGTQSAVVGFQQLPDDAYTLVVLAAGVSANGKLLDGEVDDSAWWDHTLLPSGDGQPGGDAVLTFTKLTGDSDSDGDVDFTDFSDFATCMSAPDDPCAAGCGVFDFDLDADADLRDFAAFHAAFTGQMP